MILQSLVACYEAMAAAGKLDRPGWSPVGVAYGLEVDETGALVSVIPLKLEVSSGGKTVLRPQMLTVPTQVKRASGVKANFLCDNSSYFLGIDNKDNPKHTANCFQAAGDLHRQLLGPLSSPGAQAVCRFFETWKPEQAMESAVLAESREDILKGANLVFWFRDGYVHNEPEVQTAWQTSYDARSGAGEQRRCLVTGQMAPVARLHPTIKGIRDGQPMGNSLVSFNAPAFTSYDWEQGLNAPTSEYAAFAYGAALNVLLADRNRVQTIGDATVVCWASDAECAYQDAFAAMVFGSMPDSISDGDLSGLLKKLAHGQAVNWNAVPLRPTNPFFILGLAPNAARLSVRFFIRDTFGALAEKLNCHDQRLEIVRPSDDPRESLSLWSLLNETVNQKAQKKTPSPEMSGDTLRAILTDGLYPATLYEGIQLRIRAEHRVTRGRAAIIKAYLLKNTAGTAEYQNYKEALSVELNEQTTYTPYILGRMFAVLENIQEQANPGINATIKDKYFNSACSMPDSIFPTLINLAQKHLKKIKGANKGAYVNLDRQLIKLTNTIDNGYPIHLSLHDQGIFQLGYYHQTQKRYEKKQEGINHD